MHQNKNGGRDRRTRDQAARDGGTWHSARNSIIADARVPPQENPTSDREWKQWDEEHRHVLWMGRLKEDWTNATIKGFFGHYGTQVTVTRKGREPYCFVAFTSAEAATKFTAQHNHQPLPGKIGASGRFDIRPRTRPKWYRGPDRPGEKGESGPSRSFPPHSASGEDEGRQSSWGGQGRGKQPSRQGTGSDFERYEPGRSDRQDHDKRRVVIGRSHSFLRRRSRSPSRPRLRSPPSGSGSSGLSGSGSGSSSGSNSSHREPSTSEKVQGRARSDSGVDRGDISRERRIQPVVEMRHDGRGTRAQQRQRDSGPEDKSAEKCDQQSCSKSSIRSVSDIAASGRNCFAAGRVAGHRKITLLAHHDPPLGSDTESGEVMKMDDDGDAAKQVRSEKLTLGGGGTGTDGGCGTDDNFSRWGDDRVATGDERNILNCKTHWCRERVIETPSHRETVVKAASAEEVGQLDDQADQQDKIDPGKSSRTVLLPRETTRKSVCRPERPARAESDECEIGWRQRGQTVSSCGAKAKGRAKKASVSFCIESNDDVGVGKYRHDDHSNGGITRGNSRNQCEHVVHNTKRGEESTRRTPSRLRADCAGDEGQDTDVSTFPTSHRADEQIGRVYQADVSPSDAFDADRSSRPDDSILDQDRKGVPADGHQTDQEHCYNTFEESADARAPPAGSSPLFRNNPRASEASDSTVKRKVVEKGQGKKRKRSENQQIVDASKKIEGHNQGDNSASESLLSSVDACEARSEEKPAPGIVVRTTEAVGDRSPRETLHVTPSVGDREGLKRRNNFDITLAQVIDHHMARRRLNGWTGAEVSPPGRKALYSKTIRGNRTNPDEVPRSQPDRSTIVVAAWANGDILPLAASAAAHMRLVAPLMAREPQGLRVVLRTASAVAAAAAALVLPGYRLEMTGAFQDGLVVELYPSKNPKEGNYIEGGYHERMTIPKIAGLLQDAFDRLVALDLELDTVKLPHAEALQSVHAHSSSADLLKWRNEGTATMLRIDPVPQAFIDATGEPCDGDMNDASHVPGKGLSSTSECAQILGVHCGIGPLLHRTGPLAYFNVNISHVVVPDEASPSAQTNASRNIRAVQLALTLCASKVSKNDDVITGTHREDAQARTPAATQQLTKGASARTKALFNPGVQGYLGCVLPGRTSGGLTWQQVTGLGCVAAVNKLAFGSTRELEDKIQLVEGLYMAQIGALATRVTSSGVLLVVVAGRHGASAEMVASLLCVELKVKGKYPLLLESDTYKTGAGSSTKTVLFKDTLMSAPSPAEEYPQEDCDLEALDESIAAMVNQARGGLPLRDSTSGTATPQYFDLVIVQGPDAMRIDHLNSAKIHLDPGESLSVLVDTVPQMCIDSLTPVDGTDIRMLRTLSAGGVAHAAIAEGEGMNNNGSFDVPTSNYIISPFSAVTFLKKWLVAEDTEESVWESFRESADIHVNTALPYDLSILKPMVEPLLRSVPPPTGREDGENVGDSSGDDGCRSPIYALARSMLRLLGHVEALHAPPLPRSSVLFGLVQSHLR